MFTSQMGVPSYTHLRGSLLSFHSSGVEMRALDNDRLAWHFAGVSPWGSFFPPCLFFCNFSQKAIYNICHFLFQYVTMDYEK